MLTWLHAVAVAGCCAFLKAPELRRGKAGSKLREGPHRMAWSLGVSTVSKAKAKEQAHAGAELELGLLRGRQWTVSALLVGLSIRRSVGSGERRAVETAQVGHCGGMLQGM